MQSFPGFTNGTYDGVYGGAINLSVWGVDYGIGIINRLSLHGKPFKRVYYTFDCTRGYNSKSEIGYIIRIINTNKNVVREVENWSASIGTTGFTNLRISGDLDYYNGQCFILLRFVSNCTTRKYIRVTKIEFTT